MGKSLFIELSREIRSEMCEEIKQWDDREIFRLSHEKPRSHMLKTTIRIARC